MSKDKNEGTHNLPEVSSSVGALLVGLAHVPKDVSSKFFDVIARGAGTVYAPANIVFISIAKRFSARQEAKSIVETHDILKKIVTETDVRLLSQLAGNIDNIDPTKKLEYAEKLLKSPKFSRTLKRERDAENAREARFADNTANILNKAIDFLPSSTDRSGIDQDWIDKFFTYSSRVSDDDLQLIWAQILAGKIANSNSFSPKTLRAIQDITKKEADIFVRFCSLVFSYKSVHFSIRLDTKTDEYLRFAKLEYDDLVMLEDFSLVLQGRKTLKPSKGTIYNYFDKQIIFTDKREVWTNPLSQVGSDLLTIVAREPNDKYYDAVCELFKGKVVPP